MSAPSVNEMSSPPLTLEETRLLRRIGDAFQKRAEEWRYSEKFGPETRRLLAIISGECCSVIRQALKEP